MLYLGMTELPALVTAQFTTLAPASETGNNTFVI